MNLAKPVWMTVLLLGFVALILPSSRACTIFSYSEGGSVLVGNNEDCGISPQAAMWFVPASTNGYGRVCFGWDGSAQGGMNDHGLFIDWAITPDTGPTSENPSHKPALPVKGDGTDLVLARCATVDDAIAFWDKYSYQGNPLPENPCQCLIADRTGASVVCEWIKGKPTPIRKTGPRQLITNFLLTDPQLGGSPCPRFEAVSKYFDNSEIPTVPVCADALKIAADPATLYSQVYDLSKGIVYIYYHRNFDHSLTVNLAEELRKGPHQVMLKDAFHDPTESESLALPKITASAAISAAEVLRQALEARGGATAAINIHSLHAQGVIDADVGWVVTSPTELFAMRPDLYRSVTDIKSAVGLKLGQYAQGFDGQKGWNAQTGTAPQILEGKALQERRDGGAFFGWYDAPTNCPSAVCLGEASFEGRTCYAVDMMTKFGHDEIHYYHYYDTNSFLLSGIMVREETGAGPELQQTSFGDYRKFGGFLLPTRIGGHSQGSNWKIQYNSIEVNTVEESALKMPIPSAAPLDAAQTRH